MTVTLRADAVKAVFKAIATQVSTVKISASEAGWHLYGRSDSNITVVDATIPKESFSEYEVWDDFVVDVRDILEPAAKAKDEMTIDISSGRLDIKVGRLSFRRKLVGDIEVNPKMPTLDLDAECIAPVEVFGDIMSAASGDLRFKAMKMAQTDAGLTVSIYADDTDIGTVTCEIPADDFGMISGEATARYPAGAWHELMKVIPPGTEVDVLFKKNYPMMITYSAGGAEVRMMIAPQIEEEE